MSKLVITGGTGFIGQQLAAELKRQGHQVVLAARNPPPRIDEYEWTPFDLNKPELLSREAIAGAECIFHLAAMVHVMRRSVHDERLFGSLNVRATEALAGQAVEEGVRRFIFLSSIKVHGE